MKSLFSFRLTNRLLSTGSSVTISNVRFRNTAATFTNESLVLTTDDGTTFEMCTGSASAGTLTLLTRGLDNSDTKNPVPANQKDRGAGTLVYVAALASDIFDKDAAGIQTQSGGVIFSGNNSFTRTNTFASTTVATLLLQNVTTAQMNALTGVTNGAMVYNTDAGNTYQYIGGAWAAVASGATANATETVAGKVEEATQAEFDAGTKTGSQADLFPTPDKIQKMINTSTAKTTLVDADLIGIADSAASGVNKKMTYANLKTQLNTDNNLLNLLYFGDGSDGDVTISGTVTLNRDMYYNNLTIPTSQILNPAGYKIYVRGTLSGAGKIQRNGNNATGQTAATVLGAGSLNAESAPSNGGAAGSSSVGGNAPGVTACNPCYTDTDGAAGGIGGGGSNSTGGSGATGISTLGALAQTANNIYLIVKAFFNPASGISTSILPGTLYKGMPGSGGGGGGAGVGGTGGVGGGGGGNGGFIWLAAYILNRTGTFESIGGNGGAGGNATGSSGPGGGGAAGSGNIVYYIYHTLTVAGSTSFTGGTVGAAGTGGSSASGAPAAGAAGKSGELIAIAV